MRVTKSASVLVLTVFVVIVAYSFTRQSGDTLGAQPIGHAAPAFSLPLYDGKSLSLADLKGKPVVVNFWASWCDPCREEAPTLEWVWEQYKGKGVIFLGVDIWDSEPDARAFIKEFGLTYPNGADPGGAIANQYGVTGVPETYFIGKDGKVTRKFIGAVNERQMIASIEEILR